MINANELRVGNWVIWNEDDTFMRIGPSSFLLPDARFNPIHFTPGILEKCGFISFKDGKYSMFYTKSGLQFRWHNKGNLRIKIQSGYVEIKFLHQLQNLYYALTGEELKINM